MDFKDILHYGGGGLLLVAGAFAPIINDIPGVHVDSATCIVTGLAALGIGAKADQALKVVVAALFGAWLTAAPAGAADLVAKAPPRAAAPSCTVTSCIGLFAGGFLGNSGGNLDVIGTGLTGLAQNGLGFGAQGGYEYFASNIYAAFYVDLQDDMNINAPPGTTFSSRLTYGIGGRLGYSLAGAFGAATTGTATPTLPQQFLASLMTPYINLWEGKRHNQAALRTGAGVEALLSSNVTLNADYFHYSYNQGGAAGSLAGLPVKLADDNEFRLSINRHFGF